MTNTIIITIILLVVVLALLHLRNHFRGGCCGSGNKTIRTVKTLTEPIIGKKILTVPGIHCENCQARVENAVNRIDGVACRVNLRRRTATVAYTRPVDDGLLIAAVERLGYQVTQIRTSN